MIRANLDNGKCQFWLPDKWSQA